MSSHHGPLVKTNLAPEDLVMDVNGVKDGRYYCLPPVRGDGTARGGVRCGGKFPFYLVAQGHLVGRFDNWLETKVSITGYHDNSYQGCHTEQECVEVWQRLCVLGVHPHPVDPVFMTPPSASAAQFVNVSPRKSAQTAGSPVKKEVKKEGASRRVPPSDPQVLADLNRYCCPVLPPTPSTTAVVAPASSVNFAIRGAGIVSSSVVRTEERYLEMQRRGEEPDMLVTRSIREASLFALEEDDQDF
ncbi:hypothetical protein DFH07DRAFT_973280 [Mycena maculata]|uniref:Uncharacterized protein n=1 Tax=Mycena maculata TaxID=230809 RepID=A0AAD7MI16_9AGAR|nr:hypothetical protein DFH07DRAFT_973280 [Mycena maculata]